ncbi:thiol peroxidase [Aquisalimonas asiatica]|uniref:Thiol peroxidase n=1 Tax=Aquisalimonas asiatica TaxID=406100 RepID=A0A1H8RNM5_9GAMM|nr:thiol peroxidase [Aquisalimonas asiatica]SEO67778.1 thiol peroxidase (atypical 2-Cys peroxiredoxin) [Aquisalimonas asiatica]
MAEISLRGTPVNTVGELPAAGTRAPDFKLTRTDMSELSLQDLKGKNIVLNIFPSIDTPVCANSVRRFNEDAAKRDNTVVLCVSADLPFAQSRFCGAEGLEDVIPASTFRQPEFGSDYGVAMANGPLAGLLSRAVVVVNAQGDVVYSEQVPEIGQEPDYEQALQHV